LQSRYFSSPVGQEKEGGVVKGRGRHGSKCDIVDDTGGSVVDSDEGIVARDQS